MDNQFVDCSMFWGGHPHSYWWEIRDEYFTVTEQQNESSDVSKLVIMKSWLKGFFPRKAVFLEVKRMKIY